MGVVRGTEGKGEAGVDREQVVTTRRQGIDALLKTLVLLAQFVKATEERGNCSNNNQLPIIRRIIIRCEMC